ncbi:unnamed protein product, partial [Mesorhabditis belari]|uniref:Uncharacterized protein n=1 Tax=Mesorhabditis belari TaxID=2138241 RepID=A0AAF3FQK0_9BILA
MRNLRPIYCWTRSCRRISKTIPIYKKLPENGKYQGSLGNQGKNTVQKKGFFDDYVKQMGDLSKGLVDSTSDFTTKSYEKISASAGEMGKMIDQTVTKSKEMAESTLDLTKKGLEQLGESASEAAQMTLDKSKELAEKSREIAESTADLTSKSFEKLSESVSSAAQTSFDKSKEILESTSDYTMKSFEKLGETTASAMETTMNKTKELAESTTKTIGEMSTGAFEKTKEFAEESSKTAGKIYDGMTTIAQTSFNKTKEIASSAADSSMKSLEKFGEAAASTTQSTLEKSQEIVESASKTLSKTYDQTTSMAQSTFQSVNSQIGPTLQSLHKTSKAVLASKSVQESMKQVNNLYKSMPSISIKIEVKKPTVETPTSGVTELEKKPESRLVPSYKRVQSLFKETTSTQLTRIREAALTKVENKFQSFSLISKVWKGFLYLPSSISPLKSLREKLTEKIHKFGNLTRGLTGYYVGDGWKHDIDHSQAASSAIEHFVDMTVIQLSHHLHHVTVIAVFAAALSTSFEIKRGFKLDRKNETNRHKLETTGHVISSFGGSYLGSKVGSLIGEALMPGLGTLFFGILGAFHCSTASIFTTKLLVEKFLKK